MIVGFTWIDWAMALGLAISVMIGLWRGLVYELLSLLGWVVAFVVSRVMGAVVADFLPVAEPGSWVRLSVAYALTFFVTLVLWMLLAKLARTLIAATPLSVVDRVLGAAFGGARGVLILLAVAVVASVTPLQRSKLWQASRGAAWLDAGLVQMKPLWPTLPGSEPPEPTLAPIENALPVPVQPPAPSPVPAAPSPKPASPKPGQSKPSKT